jgi:1-acyl-sn-glycerol-3-phosphate acyltransferase
MAMASGRNRRDGDRLARHAARLGSQAPTRPAWRYRLARIVLGVLVRAYVQVRVEGAERLPAPPYILCFTHGSWTDPLVIMGAGPISRRLFFFGPAEEEMRAGFRNRLMRWVGIAIPYRPGRRDMVAAASRALSLLAGGEIVGIAGEGRIHAGERAVLPLEDGPAYLALRSGATIVPLAINGSSWLGFRRVVRLRVGTPLLPASAERSGAALDGLTRELDGLTRELEASLRSLVADSPDPPVPGRFGRWLTELFNDWPEGSRPQPPRDEPPRPDEPSPRPEPERDGPSLREQP